MSCKIISFHTYTRKGVQKMKDISNERKIEIEGIVANLLNGHDFEKELFVDIVTMVKNDGFMVQSADMPIDVTGYLAVNDKAEGYEIARLIVVNRKFKNPDQEENVVLKKSRFITAHEYGHFILHKKEQKIYAHRDSDKRDNPEELEADYFARSILMPFNHFKMVNDIIDAVWSESEKEKRENIKLKLLSMIYKVTKDKIKKRLGDISELNIANV